MYRFYEQAIGKVWNHNITEATELLQPYMNSDHRAAYSYASIFGVKGNVTSDLSDRQEAVDEIDKALVVIDSIKTPDQILQIAKKVVQLNEDVRKKNLDGNDRIELTSFKDTQLINNFKLDIDCVRAEALLNKGINLFNTGALLNGAYQMRKSWKLYESLYQECLKREGLERHNEQFLHPDLVHAIYYGVGTFLFLVGFLPSGITTVLSWVGFKADRDLGLKLLQLACKNSLIAGPAASTILSIYYLFIPRAFTKKGENLKEFKPIMDNILQQFPNGSIFLFMAAHYYRKSGDIEKSMEVLDRAIESAQKAFNVVPTMYMFELSQSLIIMEKWEKASDLLGQVLQEKNKNFDLRGVATLELAVCYLHMGREEEAISLACRLDEFTNKKSRNDKYAVLKYDAIKRTIKRYGSNQQELNKELKIFLHASHYELMYLRRDIANLSATRAQTMLTSFKSTTSEMANTSEDLQAACTVIEACLLSQIKKDETIEAMLRRALTLNVMHDVQFLASANYELAELLYFRKYEEHTKESLKEIKKLLEAVDRYKGYVMEELVKNRTKLALKQVNEEYAKLK